MRGAQYHLSISNLRCILSTEDTVDGKTTPLRRTSIECPTRQCELDTPKDLGMAKRETSGSSSPRLNAGS